MRPRNPILLISTIEFERREVRNSPCSDELRCLKWKFHEGLRPYAGWGRLTFSWCKSARIPLKFQFYFENLFDLGNRQVHEICVGYRLSFDQTKLNLDFKEVGVPRHFRWCHVDELDEVDLRPIGLSSLIVASSPCHAILGSFLGQ